MISLHVTLLAYPFVYEISVAVVVLDVNRRRTGHKFNHDAIFAMLLLPPPAMSAKIAADASIA